MTWCSPTTSRICSKHDTTHGQYEGTVEAKEDGIVVDGKFVKCVSVRNPTELPWAQLGVDYVVESTGLFTDEARHAASISRPGPSAC